MALPPLKARVNRSVTNAAPHAVNNRFRMVICLVHDLGDIGIGLGHPVPRLPDRRFIEPALHGRDLFTGLLLRPGVSGLGLKFAPFLNAGLRPGPLLRRRRGLGVGCGVFLPPGVHGFVLKPERLEVLARLHIGFKSALAAFVYLDSPTGAVDLRLIGHDVVAEFGRGGLNFRLDDMFLVGRILNRQTVKAVGLGQDALVSLLLVVVQLHGVLASHLPGLERGRERLGVALVEGVDRRGGRVYGRGQGVAREQRSQGGEHHGRG